MSLSHTLGVQTHIPLEIRTDVKSSGVGTLLGRQGGHQQRRHPSGITDDRGSCAGETGLR
jgi:hypothetical protein